MYEAYWSLNDRPFRNTPDPHYAFFARQHEEAMMRMLLALTEGQGAMMLTGDCGCGKTLLSHILLDELDPDRFEVALIRYPNLSAAEFLQEVLRQLGIEAAGRDKAWMLRALEEALLAVHARGGSTLLIVDEAQMVCDPMTLEEIRLLLNFQQDRKFLLTLFLLGQPELRERVAQAPQLQQRMGMSFHVGPLDEEEGLRYLAHRLAVAGGSHEIFTREGECELVRASRGIPRRLNNLADMALMAGCGRKSSLVDEELVRRVAADLRE